MIKRMKERTQKYIEIFGINTWQIISLFLHFFMGLALFYLIWDFSLVAFYLNLSLFPVFLISLGKTSEQTLSKPYRNGKHGKGLNAQEAKGDVQNSQENIKDVVQVTQLSDPQEKNNVYWNLSILLLFTGLCGPLFGFVLIFIFGTILITSHQAKNILKTPYSVWAVALFLLAFFLSKTFSLVLFTQSNILLQTAITFCLFPILFAFFFLIFWIKREEPLEKSKIEKNESGSSIKHLLKNWVLLEILSIFGFGVAFLLVFALNLLDIGFRVLRNLLFALLMIGVHILYQRIGTAILNKNRGKNWVFFLLIHTIAYFLAASSAFFFMFSIQPEIYWFLFALFLIYGVLRIGFILRKREGI